MDKTARFAAEVRERAVLFLLEHQREHEPQWAMVGWVAGKIDCPAGVPKEIDAAGRV